MVDYEHDTVEASYQQTRSAETQLHVQCLLAEGNEANTCNCMLCGNTVRLSKSMGIPVVGAQLVLPGEPALLVWVYTVFKDGVCCGEACVHLSHESIKPAHHLVAYSTVPNSKPWFLHS